MQYALVQNGLVVTYPYSITQLRRDNPKTSFPKKPTDASLASWGVYPVSVTAQPTFSHATQNIAEGDPVLVDGQWQQTWIITDASPEEVTQRAEQQADDIRTQRDKMISDTDWMALSDNTLTPAWATYRQALRDITDHVNFPYLADEDWPVKPV